MTERPDGQVSLFDQDTWYGKTSLVPRAANKAVTSQPSSKKQSASQSRKLPIFKCLTRDGQLGGGTGTWTDDGAWLGACSTRNYVKLRIIPLPGRLDGHWRMDR